MDTGTPERLIKILFTVDSMNTGGTGRTVLNLLNNLSKDKFEINLGLLNRTGMFLSMLPKDVIISDLDFKSTGHRFIKFIKLIKDYKPDIILSTSDYLSKLAYCSCKFLKYPPCIVIKSTISGSVDIKIRSFLKRLMLTRIYSGVDRILVSNNASQRDIADNFAVDSSRIEIISNMVDNKLIEKNIGEKLSEEDLVKGSSVPLIVSMGMLEKNSGFDYLIKAFYEYRKKGDAKLVIMGEGKLMNALKVLTEKLEISSDICFTGAVSNPFKYLSAADIFVFPSLCERDSHSLLEAMACGVPVISTSFLSASSEIITSGLNGILVPPGDPQEIAEAIEKLINNSKYRYELAENAKARVSELNAENITGKYEKALINIVAGKKKKKILFTTVGVHGGGAERQIQYLLKYINRDIFDVYLIYFKKTGKEDNIIPKNIKSFYFALNSSNPVSITVNFIKYINFILSIYPAEIVSFFPKTNFFCIAAGILTNSKTYISERNYTDLNIKVYPLSFIWRLIVRFMYPMAANIITVSQDVKDNLIRYFGIKKSKITVINNGVDIEYIESRSREYIPPVKDYILACGRFIHQKGFDLLINAVKGMDVKLVIIGEGPLKEILSAKALKEGVGLILPGYMENPYPYFKHALSFILSSRYEGFPNVVLEAMVCSVPVVSFDCPGGIREIISNESTGLIAEHENVSDLSSKIKLLLNNYQLRKRIVENSRELIKQFDVSSTVSKFEKRLNKK